MEQPIKITHIIPEQWTGQDGNIRTDILGLGDDNNMYRWHRGTGKWLLHIVTR